MPVVCQELRHVLRARGGAAHLRRRRRLRSRCAVGAGGHHSAHVLQPACTRRARGRPHPQHAGAGGRESPLTPRVHANGEGKGKPPPSRVCLTQSRALLCFCCCILLVVQEWRAELLAAMQRVKRMRQLVVDALAARGTPGDWSHITRQIGMFSYTGASPRSIGSKFAQIWSNFSFFPQSPEWLRARALSSLPSVLASTLLLQV